VISLYRYDKFLRENEQVLKTLPVPEIARKYYEDDNPFFFDLYCTVKEPGDLGPFSRKRFKLENLYDVFTHIRDDEGEHWKTLCNLVQYDTTRGTGKHINGTRPSTSSKSANPEHLLKTPEAR
jgi:ubiquinol oxidase